MRNGISALLLTGGFLISHSVTACAQTQDDLARAGCPHQISRLARTSNGSQYVVYYVGGGAPACRGETRTCDEGTFGVDYKPIVPGCRNSVALGWWHGRRNQGGPGQYQPGGLVAPLPNRASRVATRREAVE